MRNLLLLFALFFGAATSSAQTFQASVLAGTNFSQVDGDELDGFHKIGLNAGIRVVAKLSDRWQVGPEILYSQSGAFRPRSSRNISDFSRFQFNTLEVPLMAFYKDWRFTAEAGFSYQRLFFYEIDSFVGEDVTDQFTLPENLVAFNAGVTYHIDKNFGVNFRWSKHLTNLDPDKFINQSSLRGRTITLRLVWTPGKGVVLPKPTITK